MPQMVGDLLNKQDNLDSIPVPILERNQVWRHACCDPSAEVTETEGSPHLLASLAEATNSRFSERSSLKEQGEK